MAQMPWCSTPTPMPPPHLPILASHLPFCAPPHLPHHLARRRARLCTATTHQRTHAGHTTSPPAQLPPLSPHAAHCHFTLPRRRVLACMVGRSGAGGVLWPCARSLAHRRNARPHTGKGFGTHARWVRWQATGVWECPRTVCACTCWGAAHGLGGGSSRVAVAGDAKQCLHIRTAHRVRTQRQSAAAHATTVPPASAGQHHARTSPTSPCLLDSTLKVAGPNLAGAPIAQWLERWSYEP